MTSQQQHDDHDSRLLLRHSNLYPADPLNTHTAPAGRDADGVSAEKAANYAAMTAAALEFSGCSRALVELAADLALLFHHNQFRSGPGQSHVTQHLLEVGNRSGTACEQLIEAPPVLHDSDGAPLQPKAVAITLGRLHDALEDFHKNFAASSVSPADAADAAEAKIRVELRRVVGDSAADEIVGRIKALSLNNTDEFPDRSYVSRAEQDPYLRCCKGADYDHNLETFPGFTETYPLMIVPAQYGGIVAGTPFEESYAQKLLPCLAAFNPHEVVPWNRELNQAGVLSVDHVKDLFDRYNEPEALTRLQTYYSALEHDLLQGRHDAYIAAQGFDKAHLRRQLTLLQDELLPNLPETLRRAPQEEAGAVTPIVSGGFVADIPVQYLGPMSSWGGELRTRGLSLEAAKQIVVDTGQRTGRRFPGYFSEDSNSGQLVYHITRYPRRAGLEVPPLSDFRDALTALHLAVKTQTADVELIEEVASADSELRIVLGLREGYFDQRKNDLLAKIADGTLQAASEIKQAIANQLGDLNPYGVNIELLSDPQLLKTALEGVSLSILHEAKEVQAFLGADALVTSAEVFSVAPDYTYSEEAVVVKLPAERAYFERLCRLADMLKQARFTVERLDLDSVVNIEIKAFTNDRSAQMI